jgi:hypothetical protein
VCVVMVRVTTNVIVNKLLIHRLCDVRGHGIDFIQTSYLSLGD